MDTETLFWIAIVFVYFVFQMLGRKRTQTQGTPPAQPQKRREPAGEELDEALREIRRALGWPEEEAPEPVRTRLPEPVQTRDPEPMRTRIPEPVQVRVPEPVQVRIPERAQARASQPVPVRPQAPAKTPSTRSRVRDRKVPSIASRLRDPKTLRQEFLIKEILDRPLALRRYR